MLTSIDPSRVAISIFCGADGCERSEEIEGTDHQESQIHAIAVIAGVLVRQEGLDASCPVLDMARLDEVSAMCTEPKHHRSVANLVKAWPCELVEETGGGFHLCGPP